MTAAASSSASASLTRPFENMEEAIKNRSSSPAEAGATLRKHSAPANLMITGKAAAYAAETAVIWICL